MMGWQDILATLEKEPDSDILAAMLKDALREERDMIDSEAERYVARVRVSAWDTRLLAQAAELLRAKGPAHEELHKEVRRIAGLDEGDCYFVVLVTGEEEPSVGVPVESLPGHGVGPGLAIALPVGWVAFWHRKNPHPVYPPGKRRRK